MRTVDLPLKGRVALVTGASRGIGCAITPRLGGRILFSGHHGSWFKVRLPSQNFNRRPMIAKPAGSRRRSKWHTPQTLSSVA